MAPGADKRISFDPPGAIGLVDRAAALLVRFDEVDTATRPRDTGPVCEDFDVGITPVSTVMPTVVPAQLGRGRLFNGATMGLATRDRDPGATLITRDATIQVVMSWDVAGQNAVATPGTVISRGLGGTTAERVCFGIRLDVVSVGSFTGQIRWYWQDVSGVERLQNGAQICMMPGQYTMLTATRRWVSPSQVELRYYIGDQLTGSVTSSDGSIGGGTTGALQIGCRTSGGVNGAFLSGTLDEIMVLDRELCAEEVEATWLRITRYQPLGVQLFRDSIDQGFPVNDDAGSDAQRDIRMRGNLLGYVGGQAENLRANFLPQRAYGSILEQWERAVAVTPQPGARSIEERRARVLSRLRQKQGISIPGLKDSLRELVDCDPDDLEFIAYSPMVTDSFDAPIDPVLWDLSPTGCASTVSGHARFAPGAGSYIGLAGWRTMARPVSQPSILGTFGGEHVTAKLSVSTPQNSFEAGVWFGNKGASNYLLLGLRRTGGGATQIVTESFIGAASQGVLVQATLGANPSAIWLHLFEIGSGSWVARWSTTSASAGFSESSPISHPALVHWGGCYMRSVAALGAGPVADFDDFGLWMPNGHRAINAYVFRDASLGGSPDLEAAHSVISEIKHAFTHATIITSTAVLSGDPGSRCDRGPMGGL